MDNSICGVHAVYEALVAGTPLIEKIHVGRETRSPRLQELLDLAHKRNIPVLREDRVALDRMAPGIVHQGIVAVAGEFRYAPIEKAFHGECPCVVLLDGVEDPHNLGAVIRTAEACGATAVVVPERHSAPLNAAAAKASAGALAYMPVIRVGNVVSTMEILKQKGLWVVGVDMDAEQQWTGFDYRVPVVLIFGGEHRGLRRLVREHCDALVRLPMFGKVSSLNVSVATGIVLYEVVRQRTAVR